MFHIVRKIKVWIKIRTFMKWRDAKKLLTKKQREINATKEEWHIASRESEKIRNMLKEAYISKEENTRQIVMDLIKVEEIENRLYMTLRTIQDEREKIRRLVDSLEKKL